LSLSNPIFIYIPLFLCLNHYEISIPFFAAACNGVGALSWPEEALRANIIAQVSLALNRIWTEWYPSRGYSFNITGSPGYDQAYVNGRTVFAVMERLTAELFSTFVQRSGDAEPYFTEYCDGKTVTCPGMKQWGTVDRAREGMNALQILRYYYGNRVQLVTTDNIAAIPSSYPGSPLRRGSTGTNVRILQKQLSRIAKDYPSFGKPVVTGTFDEATENSVKKFQKQFSLTADGVVGQRTWNTLYAAWVDAQSDLGGTAWPGTALRRGAAGMEVRLVQFWLRLAADNYSALRPVTVDGSYGAATVSAVEAFQTLFGLTPDGVVGRSTWNKLKEVGLAVANKIVAANVTPGQFTTTTRAGSSGTAVRAVQFYLRRLAAYYSDVPRVAVDGKFGAATTRAVKAWQSRTGLTVDGVVGRLTFQSLYDAAQALEASGPVVRTVSLPAPAATLRPGDTGAAVLRLNRLLLFLSQWIPEINFTASDTPDNTFDLELEIAVRSAQRYFGLTETGAVTAADWKVFRDAAEQLLAANPAGPSPKPGGVWPASALAPGSAGPAVLQVQKWLNIIAAADQTADFVPETGLFDTETQAALESYQLTAGLETLGVVDADTWESLRLAAQGLCRECQEG
jgi:peptidoglycan hydrolase-like protein with peptidoglycan-binding domain